MKKLSLLLFCLPLMTLAQQTYVPDNNFEQALINLGYDNVLDDYVTTSNINTVTSLNVQWQNISNLTGIEDFTVLSSLDCENNQLTSLDLSNNTALTFLQCKDNQLTALDVRNGNNAAFTNFYAINNPNLFCIDVDDPVYSNANWNGGATSIDTWAYFSNNCPISGCTDSTACNYNSTANIDDGSCISPTSSTTNITECDSYTWNDSTYTQSGTYSYSGAGSNNYSMSFDGVDDWVEIPQGDSFFGSSGDFTVSSWVKIDQFSGNQEPIFESNIQNELQLMIVNNNGRLTLNAGGGLIAESSVLNWNLNQWYYVTVSNNLGIASFYRDGNILGISYFNSGNINSRSFSSLCLGKDDATNNFYLNGSLDEFTYFNIALSTQEIQNYMHCPPLGNESGLLSYWDFEEGSGTTALDQTLNGNDGTINGAIHDINVPAQSCGLTNANGCDSTAVLNLTLTGPDTSYTNITACDSLVWNGTTYTISGTYSYSGASIFSQLGQDIYGAYNDGSGGSVSLSGNSNRLAIGGNWNDGSGNNLLGHVRVYEKNGSTWVQIGQDIDRVGASEHSGSSISLSNDGNILAIGSSLDNNGNGGYSGHVRVYFYDGNIWNQLGQDIDGEASGDQSGCSVSLSSDGNMLAIGAYGNNGNTGHVRIYNFNGTSWNQLGQDIDGEASGDQSGCSVSLSSDGYMLAIGAYGNSGNGSSSGHVRVYNWSGTSWNQLGQDIDGEAANDWTGRSVSLSGDGNIVAIGAYGNDANGNESGHVRIYEYITGVWILLGQDIDGEAAGDYSGYSVSLSSDGNIVAIGAYRNDGNGSNSGHVRIYNYNGISWNQLGQDIDGEAADDQSGASVSLSSDGSTVSIGAPQNDGNGSNAGHVRVYNLSNLTNTNGCDSIAVLDLTINNAVTTSDTITLCDGASVTIGNNTYTDAGNYTDTLLTTNGCDSIVNITLEVIDVNITQNDTSICFGDSISLDVSIDNQSQSFCSSNQPSILYVPSQYPTIQSALNNALTGDTVKVANGTYIESNLTITKSIVLISENGNSNCIINGSNGSGNIFDIDNVDSCSVIIDGFVIKGAYVTSGCGGGNSCGSIIEVQGLAKFLNCILEDNYDHSVCFEGSGIDQTFFINCIARNNSAQNYAGFQEATLINCLIYNNNASNNGSPIIECKLINCTVTQNSGGCVYPTVSASVAENSIIWGNSCSEQFGNGWLGGSAIANYCIIESGTYTGIANGNWNPQFSSGNFPFSLAVGSPAIDAGNPDLDGDGINYLTDLDDQDYNGTRLDIGANILYQWPFNSSISNNNYNAFLWSTGDTTANITVSPSQTTTYWITQTQNGVSCTDSVTVTVLPTTSDTSYITACDSYAWNGTTYDSSGTYSYSSEGSNNYSMSFNGNHVDLGNSSTLSPSSLITLMSWSKPLQNKNGQMIATKGSHVNQSNRTYQMMGPQDNGLWVSSLHIDGLGEQYLSSQQIANLNQWTHTCLTYDGTVIKYYINGVLNDSIIISGNVYQTSNPLYFGDQLFYAASDYKFYGNIDDIQIWNTSLTHTEIQQYMNCSPTGNEAGLVGYWNFEQGSGTTAYDQTSNGNHGTINGASYGSNVPVQSCGLTNTNGCDSIAALNLTINNFVTTSDTITLCDGASVTIGNNTYTSAGNYTDSLLTANGCDSIVYSTIEVIDVNITQNDTTICYGDSINISLLGGNQICFDNYMTYMGSFNNHHYYFSDFNSNPQGLYGSEINPAEADSIFNQFGSYLVSINSTAENNFISSLIPSNIFAAWIGLSDYMIEGNYQWFSNEPFSYSNWRPGEPNNSCGNEDYVIMYGPNSSNSYSSAYGKWNDEPCPSNCAPCNNFLFIVESEALLSCESSIYTWSTGDTTANLTVSPSQTTTYYATQTKNGVTCTDSVTVTVADTSSSVTNITACDSVVWNGTTYNSSGTYSTSVGSSNNYVMDFDGVDDYVEISNSVDFDLGDFTVIFKFKTPSTTSNSLQGLLSKSCDGCEATLGDWFISYNHTDSGRVMLFTEKGGLSGFARTGTLALDTWYNIGVRRIESTGELFITSNIIGINTDTTFSESGAPTGIINNTESFVFGDMMTTAASPYEFEGFIDDVSLWNFNMTYQTMKDFMTCPPIGNESGLVGYWNFEEGSGTTALDLTSNGNNGTIYGNAIYSTNVPSQSCALTNTNGCDSIAVLNLTINQADGCIDSTAFNYDPNALCDDGSCIYDIYGCTDPTACNYDSIANTDDGSCAYATTSTTTESACDSYTWNDSTYTQSGTYSYSGSSSNNYSMSFDGANNYVEIYHNPSLELSDLSITFWMKTNNLASGIKSLIAKENFNNNDVNGEWWVYINHMQTDKVNFFVIENNTYGGVVHNTLVNDDIWHFVGVTRNGLTGEQTISIDGQNIVTAIGPSGLLSEPVSLYFGGGNNYNYDGLLDDVAIWNTSLSQQEIQNYMNCPPIGTESGLVGYWNFEEGSGTTAYDQTSNGNDGVINGANYDSNVPAQSCGLTNTNGCDSTAALNLTINPSTTSTSNVTECNTYTWNGQAYTTSGVYTFASTNSNGCDSTAELNLTIEICGCTQPLSLNYNPNATIDDGSCIPLLFGCMDSTACNYDPNANAYDPIGIPGSACIFPDGCTDNLACNYDPLATCDDSSCHYPVTVYTSDTACAPYGWLAWAGTSAPPYWQSGTYTCSGQYTTVDGCDSTIILDLTINNSPTTIETQLACNSFTWIQNGVTYYNSQLDSVVYTNSFGCDSTIILDLTINTSTSNSTTETACDSYTWSVNGTAYYSSGTYTYVSTNAYGCDHTEILTLIINNTSTLVIATACDSYTWNPQGFSATYASSGIYINVWGPNAAGCAQTDSLILTINNSTSNSTTVTVCDSYTWGYNGLTYTTSGTYTDVSTNAAGCTNTETLNLTITTNAIVGASETACDSYTWHGNTYTSTGIQYWTGQDVNSCDSTVELYITINSSTASSVSVTECDAYVWNGNTYTTSGTYTDVSTNAAGCTNTETLNLTITTNAIVGASETACDSYTWHGNTYTSTGIQYWTGQDVNSCDSTVELYITINSSTASSVSVTECDTHAWNGIAYTSSGIYTYSTTNSNGCDSTATLNLTIITGNATVINMTKCNDYFWPMTGNTYTSSGSYLFADIGSSGCMDSVTLNLTINSTPSSSSAVTTCDSYTWDNSTIGGLSTTYTMSGIYTEYIIPPLGCAHTDTLNLTINSSTSNSSIVTACNTYTWNGIAYTSSGIYTYSTTNSNGCDSTATLNLTINPSTESTTNVTECDTYSWNGNTYTASGTYSYLTTNVNSCDSTAILNLIVLANSIGLYLDTICDGDSLLVNGNMYHQAGDYSDTLIAASGCDSVVTITLYQTPNSFSNLIVGNDVVAQFAIHAYQATPPNASSTYTWGVVGSSANIVSGQGAVQIDVEFHTAGNQIIYFIEISADGCVGDTVFMHIYSEHVNTVSDINTLGISIHPNPTKGLVTISFNSNTEDDYKVIILNVVGEYVFTKNLDNYKGNYKRTVDLSSYSKGMYFLEIETHDRIINKKLILQ